MNISKRVVLWTVVALNIIVVLYVLLTVGGSAAQPLRLSSVSSPEGTVEGFFRALSSRDFETADEYISNYRTLGLSEPPASDSDALSVYIYDRLFESYSISPVSGHGEMFAPDEEVQIISPSDVWLSQNVLSGNSYSVSGGHAKVSTEYTCLDTGKMSARLTELLRDIAERTAGSGIAVDNDETALELFGESVEALKAEDIRLYYSRSRIDIELVYIDKMWKIVLTPELYDALTGRFPEEDSQVNGSDADNYNASEPSGSDGGDYDAAQTLMEENVNV